MLRLWSLSRSAVAKSSLFRPLSSSPALFNDNISEIPPYDEKFNEPLEEKRSRLLYQSRKRGMLENGLLLGSFANKHLDGFDEEHLVLYDRLINLPSNDWDIFYWATGAKETPEEFNNKVMDLLKEHTRNKDRESRIHLPHLKEKN
jgi:succinate dehydrogenase assembly factor 2